MITVRLGLIFSLPCRGLCFFGNTAKLFLKGKLVIDKDLVSEILIRKGIIEQKEYSEKTILLTTTSNNSGAIRKTVKEKELSKLVNLLKSINQKKAEEILNLF